MDEHLFDVGGGNMLPMIWAMEPMAMAQLVATLQHRFTSGVPLIGAGPVDEAARRGLPIRNAGGGTALISLNGPMTKGSTFETMFGFGTSTDSLRAAFVQARNDKDISSILFKVTSPGGSVDSLAELADTVAEVAQIKNVVALVEGQAASAAYFVASQATKIFAGRGDMVGSIGTKMQLMDLSGAFEKDGIKTITIDTGAFKSIGAPGAPITDEQIAHLQSIVDAHFDIFVQAVTSGRKRMSEKAVRAVADGRMFMASDALSLGLIDGISTFEKTLLSLQKQGSASTSSLAARTQAARHRHQK
jgi:signal peptide peptidase SppA